jgi:hypothetical protein
VGCCRQTRAEGAPCGLSAEKQVYGRPPLPPTATPVTSLRSDHRRPRVTARLKALAVTCPFSKQICGFRVKDWEDADRMSRLLLVVLLAFGLLASATPAHAQAGAGGRRPSLENLVENVSDVPQAGRCGLAMTEIDRDAASVVREYRRTRRLSSDAVTRDLVGGLLGYMNSRSPSAREELLRRHQAAGASPLIPPALVGSYQARFGQIPLTARLAFDRPRRRAVVEMYYRASGVTYLANWRDGKWTLKRISAWIE